MASKRRARGLGALRYRPDRKRWEGRVMGAGEGGGPRYVYAATQREAQAAIDRIRAEIAAGVRSSGAGVTVERYLSDWLVAVKPQLRETTWRRYEGITRTHLIPRLGRRRLGELEPSHVERMLAGIVDDGRTHRTAHHARSVLRAALARAVRQGQLVRNVAALAEWRQAPRVEIQPLDVDERLALWEALRDHNLEPLVLTAAGTGLRQGELLGLRWQDVGLDEGSIRIRLSLQRGKLVPTKTEKSKRTIDLDPELVDVLRRHKVRQAEALLHLGRRQDVETFVFASPTGESLSGTNVTRRFQELLNRAGLRPIRFHDLRHLFATVLLEEGEDIRVVSDLLGHSTTTLTWNTYQHVLPHRRRAAAGKAWRGLGLARSADAV